MTSITLSLPDKIHAIMEVKRGDIPRSLQYRRLLLKELKKELNEK